MRRHLATTCPMAAGVQVPVNSEELLLVLRRMLDRVARTLTCQRILLQMSNEQPGLRAGEIRDGRWKIVPPARFASLKTTRTRKRLLLGHRQRFGHVGQ